MRHGSKFQRVREHEGTCRGSEFQSVGNNENTQCKIQNINYHDILSTDSMRFTHFTVGFQWILNVQFVFNFSLDLWTESRSMNQIKQHHTFLVHRYGRAHHIDFEHSAFSIGDHLHSVPSGGYGLHRKHRPDTVVLAAVGGGYTVQVPSRKIFKRRPWNKRVVPVHQDDVLLLVNGKLEGHSVVLLD
mgnify:CR=1 FL=1